MNLWSESLKVTCQSLAQALITSISAKDAISESEICKHYPDIDQTLSQPSTRPV